MIKVNLVGAGRKKAKARSQVALPTSFAPVLLILIIAGTLVGGYLWWSRLTAQSAELEMKKQQAEAEKAVLEKVIKADQVYEGRQKALKTRVNVILGLQKNQVSPVIALDQLAEAVDKTRYVWLSSLDQNNAVINLSGTGTSLNAIADFYSNMQATGYFKNLDLGPSSESSGNWTFSLKCEFSPPRPAAPNAQPAAGGN
jgi:Tfp pilus assembly protein PilN